MAVRRTSQRLKDSQNPLRTILDRPNVSRTPKQRRSLEEISIPKPARRGPRAQRHSRDSQDGSESQADNNRLGSTGGGPEDRSVHPVIATTTVQTEVHKNQDSGRHTNSQQSDGRQKPGSGTSEKKAGPIGHWLEEGTWPAYYFESVNKMSSQLCRQRSSTSSYTKSKTDQVTTTNRKTREQKSVPYAKSGYPSLLQTKGVFMNSSEVGISDKSRDLCRILLRNKQLFPQDTLFRDDVFTAICRKLNEANEAMVIQDISRLIVPSAQNLAILGDTHLRGLVETVDEIWKQSIPLTGARPRPDYSVGFRPSVFTEDQRKRLAPFIGDLYDTSFFVTSWRQHFPFLTCEVKRGTIAIEIADRQNAHSASLAVRGVVELYRLVKREKELNQEILAFSVSHDHTGVRIYGHYPLIDQEKVTYYRHMIRSFDFTDEDGRDRWTAYQFTRNVYDIFMPMHLRRICSAVDQLPLETNFEVSPQSSPPSSKNSG